MFNETKAFSGFSVDDVDAAADFYGNTLGISIERSDMGFLTLHIAGDRPTFVYPKGEHHEPASFTILNFPTADIVATVTALKAKGIEMLRYEDQGVDFDDLGIARNAGPNIAWFKDPAGNVLAVIEVEDE